MEREVQVRIVEEDADTERLAVLSDALRTELLGLDVDDVIPVSGGAPPTGARGLDAETVGALLVTGQAAVDLLGPLVATVRSWLGRTSDPARRCVELTVGDKTLRLTDASEAQQDRLVDEFLRAVARD